MLNELSFPGLGLSMELNRVAFSVGPIDIYWYGIIMASSFLLGILYCSTRVKEVGLDLDRVLDVVLIGAVGAIIGARTYYVLFQWDDYKDNLMQVFNTRSGGLAIYGGLIGAVIAGYLASRWRKVKFLPLADLSAAGFLIGQSLGRWGNFVNIEAFGGNTTMPWGMTSPVIVEYLERNKASLEAIGMTIDPNMPVHPTFFYESIWCLIGFIIIALYTKHRKFDGQLILIYIAWYGAGRAVIEGFRTDSLMIGNTGFRASQILAGVLTIVAIGTMNHMLKKVKDDPNKNMLYVNTKESRLVVEKRFNYR